jgi:hypothetical protein
LQIMAVDWAEVTAIATSVLAVGLLGAIGAAVFAGQQVREARKSREAQMAAEFFRRWNEDALVEARQLVGGFRSPDELRDAFAAYVADGSPKAYVLYRELDYFEQLAALERQGAISLELIKMLLGHTLIDRWRMWKAALDQAHGPGTYPLFEDLAMRLEQEIGSSSRGQPQRSAPRDKRAGDQGDREYSREHVQGRGTERDGVEPG